MSDFDTMDNYGWTSMPTGVEDTGGGLESVYVTPMQTLPSFDGSSGFNVDNFGKALQYGVQAYGQIKSIDHGGYSGYQPAAPAPDHIIAPSDQYAQDAPPQPGAGFDWSQLTNFSTPYPWAIGIAGLLVLTLTIRAVRR
jgi:hypothetical protein